MMKSVLVRCLCPEPSNFWRFLGNIYRVELTKQQEILFVSCCLFGYHRHQLKSTHSEQSSYERKLPLSIATPSVNKQLTLRPSTEVGVHFVEKMLKENISVRHNSSLLMSPWQPEVCRLRKSANHCELWPWLTLSQGGFFNLFFSCQHLVQFSLISS